MLKGSILILRKSASLHLCRFEQRASALLAQATKAVANQQRLRSIMKEQAPNDGNQQLTKLLTLKRAIASELERLKSWRSLLQSKDDANHTVLEEVFKRLDLKEDADCSA